MLLRVSKPVKSPPTHKHGVIMENLHGALCPCRGTFCQTVTTKVVEKHAYFKLSLGETCATTSHKANILTVFSPLINL